MGGATYFGGVDADGWSAVNMGVARASAGFGAGSGFGADTISGLLSKLIELFTN